MKPNWETICESLRDRPEEWRAGQYVLTHSSGVCLWVGNGRRSLKPYNSATDVHLCRVGRKKVWEAYREWKCQQLEVFMATKVEV